MRMIFSPTFAFVALGAGATTVYAVTDSLLLKAVIAILIALFPVVALARFLRHGHAPRLPWVLIAIGQTLWLAGWLPWEASILGTGAPPSPFSLADGFFLPAELFIALGLVAVIRVREPRGGGTIETVMIAATAGLISWLALIQPALEGGILVGTAGATQAAYALVDVLLLAVLTRALLGRLRDTSYFLLLAGGAGLLAANTAWNWLYLAGGYVAGGYYDLGWLALSLLVGAAMVHPSAANVARPIEARAGTNWRALTVFIVAGFAGPSLGWVEVIAGIESDSAVVVAIRTALIALVLARAFMLLRDSIRIQRVLAAQNDELKQLDRLKDDFVASVSHELRTPLTSIRGYLELVRDGDAGDLNAQQDEFLGVVDRNAERLLRVVGDLLFVAQLDAGAMPLQRGSIDVAELARHSVDSARTAAEERGIALSLELGALPDEVSGDGTRLAQALDNLVSNAIKFTPSGGRVAMTATTLNGNVELAVADSGPGISLVDQARLFQRFFRTAESNEQAVPGTGLGLAISKAIVEAHGGTIGVTSRPGAGSEFRIVFPAAA